MKVMLVLLIRKLCGIEVLGFGVLGFGVLGFGVLIQRYRQMIGCRIGLDWMVDMIMD